MQSSIIIHNHYSNYLCSVAKNGSEVATNKRPAQENGKAATAKASKRKRESSPPGKETTTNGSGHDSKIDAKAGKKKKESPPSNGEELTESESVSFLPY